MLNEIKQLLEKQKNGFATVDPTNNRRGNFEPTAKWTVNGFPHLRAALFMAPSGSRNAGEAYADIRRIAADGKLLKLLRVKADSVGAVLGFCSVWERMANDETTPDVDRRLYAELAQRVSAVIVEHINPRGAGTGRNATSAPNSEGNYAYGLGDGVSFD